jgi:hypothetical protein
MLEGLSILLKYKPDAYVEAEHDAVAVNVDGGVDISPEDKTRLDELGWFIGEDFGDCWGHFT